VYRYAIWSDRSKGNFNYGILHLWKPRSLHWNDKWQAWYRV